MRGVGNRHLQTMLRGLIRRKTPLYSPWQRLELPDAILSIWHGVKTLLRRAINLVCGFHGPGGGAYTQPLRTRTYPCGNAARLAGRGDALSRPVAAKPTGITASTTRAKTEDGSLVSALAPGASTARFPPPRWDIRSGGNMRAACWQKKATLFP